MDKEGTENRTPWLDSVIVSRLRDLTEGVSVRRILPAPRRRMVGPFIFLDQMGPEVLRSGSGIDVPPHPHIGLATVTYLFEGELLHRDSLGTVETIRPGEVNWMTAGRGIVHSERTPPESRAIGSRIHGLQSWVALPRDYEEVEPEFTHYDAPALPVIEGDGVWVRLIAGELFGECSPVKTLSDLFYAEVRLSAQARVSVPAEHEDRAVYVVEGAIADSDGGEIFESGQLLVLKPGATLTLGAARNRSVRLMLLGGEPLAGPGHNYYNWHIWWNFVSTSKERIEQAKADWQAGRFPLIPGEGPVVPLP